MHEVKVKVIKPQQLQLPFEACPRFLLTDAIHVNLGGDEKFFSLQTALPNSLAYSSLVVVCCCVEEPITRLDSIEDDLRALCQVCNLEDAETFLRHLDSIVQ